MLFDTDKPHWCPRHHIPSVLVYQAHSSDIRSVMIDGRMVLDENALSFAGPDELPILLEEAQRASEAIVERAGMTPLLSRGWQSQSLL